MRLENYNDDHDFGGRATKKKMTVIWIQDMRDGCE
jgi:protein tyrosine/serine phosphatase